jgi:hypothetical protein
MFGFAPLACAPLADHGRAQTLGTITGGVSLDGTTGSRTLTTGDAASILGLGGASTATVSASLQALSPFALSGDTSAAAAAQAEAERAFTVAGHSAVAVFAQLGARAVVSPLGDARGEISSLASIDGGFVVDRQMDAETAIFGEGARVLPLFGNSGGQISARAASGGALLLSGVGLSEAKIAASGTAGIGVEGAGSGASAISVDLRSRVTVDGLGTGVSLVPLFLHVGGRFGIEGAAEGQVATQGESGQTADLSGFARKQAAVAGTSAVPIKIGLASAAAMGVGATASPVFLLKGDGRAAAYLRSAASTDLSLSGATSGLLPVRAEAACDFAVQGRSDALTSLTGTAVGALEVKRELGTKIAIVSDAARDMPLQGQSVAQIAAQGASLCDAPVLSGVAKALTASTAHLVSRLGLSGLATARNGIRSDASSDVEVGVSASASAARQVTAEGSAGLSGTSGVQTKVSSATQAPMPLSGTAEGNLAMTARAQGDIAFARRTLAVAHIDAASKRILPFALHARAKSVLSAQAAASVSLYGQAGAILPAQALVSSAVDLIGAATAIGEVAAVGQSGVELNGMAQAGAPIGADGHGVVSISSASMAETAILGGSARSLRLGGSSTVLVSLVAGAAGGKVDLRLSAALGVAAAQAVSAGDIALDGVTRSHAALFGATTGFVVLARFGAGDVAITSESARLILFPGYARLAIASTGLASGQLVIGADLRARIKIGAQLEIQAFMPAGTGTAIGLVAGAVQQSDWPLAGSSLGFRAPPALQRLAPPNTRQGGSLMPSLRSGRILRG